MTFFSFVKIFCVALNLHCMVDLCYGITKENNENNIISNSKLIKAVTPSKINIDYNPLVTNNNVNIEIVFSKKIEEFKTWSTIDEAKFQIIPVNNKKYNIFYTIPNLLFTRKNHHFIYFHIKKDEQSFVEDIPIHINPAIEWYYPKIVNISKLNDSLYFSKSIKFKTILSPGLLKLYMKNDENIMLKDIIRNAPDQLIMNILIKNEKIEKSKVIYLKIESQYREIKIPFIYLK